MRTLSVPPIRLDHPGLRDPAARLGFVLKRVAGRSAVRWTGLVTHPKFAEKTWSPETSPRAVMASREYNSCAGDALREPSALPQTGRGGTNLGPGRQDRRSRGLALSFQPSNVLATRNVCPAAALGGRQGCSAQYCHAVQTTSPFAHSIPARKRSHNALPASCTALRVRRARAAYR